MSARENRVQAVMVNAPSGAERQAHKLTHARGTLNSGEPSVVWPSWCRGSFGRLVTREQRAVASLAQLSHIIGVTHKLAGQLRQPREDCLGQHRPRLLYCPPIVADELVGQ